jgi:hypothetical protein
MQRGRPALLYGCGAFAAVLILGQITAARILQAGTSQSLWSVLQRGFEGFFLLNPAAIRMVGPPGEGLDILLRVDLLIGTAVAGVILYRGGRVIALRGSGGPMVRAAQGMVVAIPYALLAFGLSFLVSLRTASPVLVGSSPLSAGDVVFTIPHLWAFGGTLVLGCVAGFAGGLMSARDRLVSDGGWGRRIVAALTGGWRMLLVGLGLAFIGLLVVLALDASIRHAYVGAFHSGFGKSPFVMSAPNQALFVLVPAMGGCAGIYGGATRIDLLCYSHFPLAAGTFGTAPAQYFVFLVAPLVAVVAGGVAAARAGLARGRGDGAVLGVLAGVVFAGLLTVAAAIGSPAIHGMFAARNVAGYAGPFRPNVLVAGLVWGSAGGAIGGFLAGVTPARLQEEPESDPLPDPSAAEPGG